MAAALSRADSISASVAPLAVVLASSALIFSMIELWSAMSRRLCFLVGQHLGDDPERLLAISLLGDSRQVVFAGVRELIQGDTRALLSFRLCAAIKIRKRDRLGFDVEGCVLCPPLLRADLGRLDNALGRFRYIGVCNGNRLRRRQLLLGSVFPNSFARVFAQFFIGGSTPGQAQEIVSP